MSAFVEYQQRRWAALGLVTLPDEHVRISPAEVRNLATTASHLRSGKMVGVPGRDGKIVPPQVTSIKHVLSLQLRLNAATNQGPVEMTPALMQMMQAEDEPSRSLLVGLLAQNESAIASMALAQRAIFDVSPAVREAAVNALKARPRMAYRQVLLDGLRHPWAPAADHAAETLVALRDREVVPELERFVDLPNPSRAISLPGPVEKTVVREFVRVNHLRNCLLCHAVASNATAPITGLVPTPGKALSPQYYASRARSGEILVRADISYFRQDFSVVQPVEKAAPWPESQRYDYLVRTRVATADEVAALQKPPATYPQREAVLFALKELSR